MMKKRKNTTSLITTLMFVVIFATTFLDYCILINGATYSWDDGMDHVKKDVSSSSSSTTTTSARHNYIRNPGIEILAGEEDEYNTSPRWWQPFIVDYRMSTQREQHSGTRSLVFEGSGSAGWQGCGQLAYIDQHRPADLVLSVWGQLEDVEYHDVGVYADIRYQDGSALMDQTIIFGQGTKTWHQKSIVLEAPKPIHVVMVYVVLDGVYGTAYFDDFSLVESKELPLSLLISSSKLLSDGTSMEKHWCVSASVCDTDNGPFHVINNFLTADTNPDPSDITSVTQLSADRLQRIQQIARVWKGPISAAVYAKKNNFEATRLMLSIWKKSKLVRTHVDLHLVSRDAYMDATPYPINMLRNIAWKHARTDQLFLLDVDFVPNPGMREYVKDIFPKLRKIKGLEHAAYIVPAFGSAGVKKWPKNRQDLKRLIDVGVVKPVHAAKLEAAHGATNYERWYKTKNPFQVLYELFFEPYVIVSKDMPMYDQRFSGYGHDKSSHIFELYMRGYNLIVLPEAFVIHIEHGVPHWRNTANKTRIWVNWYSFALQKEEQFRDVGAKAYFSGSWQRHLKKDELPPHTHALQALFSEGDMETARKLAISFIGKKSATAKRKFWEENIAHNAEALRSLIRELVHRFHNNVEPLRQTLIPNPKHLEGIDVRA